MRISDWSSDVCSSDLGHGRVWSCACLRRQIKPLALHLPARIGDDGIGEGRHDLGGDAGMDAAELGRPVGRGQAQPLLFDEDEESQDRGELARGDDGVRAIKAAPEGLRTGRTGLGEGRSEEHTSELQSLMRISYAVFCLKKKQQATN